MFGPSGRATHDPLILCRFLLEIFHVELQIIRNDTKSWVKKQLFYYIELQAKDCGICYAGVHLNTLFFLNLQPL